MSETMPQAKPSMWERLLRRTMPTPEGLPSPTLKTPPIPDQLWMLMRHDGEWVVAYDDPRDAENYLVCLTEGEAIAAAWHQADTYDIPCIPVRVK